MKGKRNAVLMILLIMISIFVVPVTTHAAVKISAKTVTLIKGQSTTLKVTGTKKKITWSSNKKSVATVTSNGKVTAKAKGTATITAKYGSSKLTCKVTVETPSLNKKSVTIENGKTYQLKLNGTSQKVTWASSNKAVATVTSAGKVTAKSVGTAKITATVLKKKYTCTVTVKKPSIKSIQFKDKSIIMVLGARKVLDVTITPSTYTKQDLIWEYDSYYVQVDSNGVVTANTKAITDSTKIVAKSPDGTVYDECYITIISKAEATYRLLFRSVNKSGVLDDKGAKSVSFNRDGNTFKISIKENSFSFGSSPIAFEALLKNGASLTIELNNSGDDKPTTGKVIYKTVLPNGKSISGEANYDFSKISDLKKIFTFDIPNIDLGDTFNKLTDEANSALQYCITTWKDLLAKLGINASDLPFFSAS